MKTKFVAGAVALALVAPIVVPVTPIASGQVAETDATQAGTLNPRLWAFPAFMGTSSTGTTLRDDLADESETVRSIELESWESPYPVELSTAPDTSFLGRTTRIWVEPKAGEKYPSKFDIDLKARVSFKDGSSGLFPCKLTVRVDSELTTRAADLFEPSLTPVPLSELEMDDDLSTPGYHWAYKIEGIPKGTHVTVTQMRSTVGKVVGNHIYYWAPTTRLLFSDKLPVRVTVVYDDLTVESKEFELPAKEARRVEESPTPTATSPKPKPTETTKPAPTTDQKPAAQGSGDGSSVGAVVGVIIALLAVIGFGAAASGMIPGVKLPF